MLIQWFRYGIGAIGVHIARRNVGYEASDTELQAKMHSSPTGRSLIGASTGPGVSPPEGRNCFPRQDGADAYISEEGETRTTPPHFFFFLMDPRRQIQPKKIGDATPISTWPHSFPPFLFFFFIYLLVPHLGRSLLGGSPVHFISSFVFSSFI